MKPESPPPRRLFLRGARQLLTLGGPAPRRGLRCSDLGLIRDGGVLIEDGRIDEVGSTRRIENLSKARDARTIDATGRVVLPGFVDCDFRPPLDEPPLAEFERRIAGAETPAEAIPAARRGARPPAAELLRRARRWSYLAASSGTTTAALRFGFDAEPEETLRRLRLAAGLDGDPIETLLALCAAPGAAADALLRAAARLDRRPALCEIECRDGRRGGDAGRIALELARELGFAVEARAGRSASLRGVAAALAAGARAILGLEDAGEAEIDAIAASRAVAVLLPAATLAHRDGPAPGRRLIDRGAAVALASGFGSDTGAGFGLPLAMALACREMRLMPEEAIACVTINAAAALGLDGRLGSIEPDKQADLVVFDVPDYREIPYYVGVNLCSMTIKAGRIVARAGSPPPPPNR